MGHILAIDQGTTSSRAIVFGPDMRPLASVSAEFAQHYPRAGWVEHDAEEIWHTVVDVTRRALDQAGSPTLAALGITNQRETVVVWDRATGAPLGRAIVWQDRRTADLCAHLRDQGAEAEVTARTGLLLDPYFSATKLAFLLDHVEGARARAARGELAFGTIDSFLIWRLTGGAVHATDATNAARTMLYNIHRGAWDEEMCRMFDIPMAILPEVRNSADDFGLTSADLFGRPIPIRGVAGDQQAATVGQACFAPGMVKATYGTGCFALLNTGDNPVQSRHRLLTTIAYQIAGKPTYALEGSIFIAGAAVQWLRDGLGLIKAADATATLAAAADPGQELILVPAFTGLGAPYWRPECRGAVFGLNRNSGPKEMARAALESVGFQTHDLWAAMRADWPEAAQVVLRVDGGMSASDWTMQFLADILGAPVDRPQAVESTALGAAWLAGMEAGVWPDQAGFAAHWQCERRFTPHMDEAERARRLAGWRRAVEAVMLAARDG